MARHQRDRLREQTWRRHLDRQKASGQSVRAYCLHHKLAETAFHHWRRTIKARDDESTGSAALPTFVPMTVVEPSNVCSESRIDIHLAGGHRVRVRTGCNRELLAMVIGLLERQSC